LRKTVKLDAVTPVLKMEAKSLSEKPVSTCNITQ